MSHRHLVTVYDELSTDFDFGRTEAQLRAIAMDRTHGRILDAALLAQQRSTPPQERAAQARWASHAAIGYGWGV